MNGLTQVECYRRVMEKYGLILTLLRDTGAAWIDKTTIEFRRWKR
jgi:hypothetical protein